MLGAVAAASLAATALRGAAVAAPCRALPFLCQGVKGLCQPRLILGTSAAPASPGRHCSWVSAQENETST